MFRFKTLIVVLCMCTLSFALENQIPVNNHPATDAHSDWRVAMQLWTFHNFTFFEAIEKTAELGISWVEAFPGQRLSPDHRGVGFDPSLSPEQRAMVKGWLNERGLRLVNYGVTDLPNDEAKCRQVFDFAKDMGIETLCSEPPEEALAMIDKLCQEYKINVAIHNHPEPSHYWNPETVLKAAQGRSKYIGACADNGHWPRSGVNPIEAIKKLQGRIISFHFKDLNEFGKKDAHDVPWGTGAGNIAAVLDELKRQGFKGVFSVEYEYNWDNSIPEIRQCLNFFNAQTAKLFGKADWKPVFADDLSNAVMEKGGWEFKDGVLSALGNDDIWTKELYGDFVLDLEFKLATETNSGVFVRTGSLENWLHTAIEVQVLDSYGKATPNREDCGAIFDCLEPSKNAVKKPGEWNRYTITCQANKINVVLNGQPIIDMDLNRWTDAHKNPDGTPNKFNTAYKDMPREGHIGLQYHGHPIWYRNVKIKVQ